ncbi:hypothetical protein FGIG_01666 [Fasciola gigantica]|uniref:Uncharacterized protein n=1 Tax=Fasciola gigantica TaxID=46835 RepID=A0A504YJU8_FASGI|nr:hypothetical protein FGIG_01666 [Fasciola gigantica]
MKQVRSGIWMQIDRTVDFTNTVVGAKRWSYGISAPDRTVTSTLRITDDIRTKLSVSECIQMEVAHAELLNNVEFRGEQVWLPNGKTSDSDRMREAILVAKFQNKSKTYEYALYSLKSLEDGEYGSPSDNRPVIDRPVHGDSAFTTVQTFRPHVYNTATWRRVGCDLNISQFVRPRQSFRWGEGRPVDLFPLRDRLAPNTKASVSSRPEQHIDANKPHRFAVHDKSREWPRMTFRMLGQVCYEAASTDIEQSNRSFIREAFCESPTFGGHRLGITKKEGVHLGYTFLKPAIEIHLSSVQSTRHERSLVLTIAGHVTGTPAYINVQIRYREYGTLLAHHDFVIFPRSKSELTLQTSEKSETFELNYTFGDATSQVNHEQFNSYEPLVNVIVTDCGSSRYFGLRLTSNQINSKFHTASFASRSTAKMTIGEEITDESLRRATYTPLFIICSCVGTSYLLVCLVYTLIRHFSFNYGKFTVHTSMISSGELNEPAVYHEIPLAPQSFRLNRGGQLYSARLGTEDSLYYGRNQDEAHQYNPTVVRMNSSNWHRLHLGEFSPWTIYATRCRTNVLPIRRLLLFAHLAFRVFYTFLFTFSVAVSLIFSLQPAPRPGAAEMVVQRPPVVASPGTGPWTVSPYSRKNVLSGSRRMLGPLLRLQTESRWLEAFAEQELRRQLDYVDRMKVACQHAVGVEITDAVREMRQMVQDYLDKWHYGTKVDDAVVNIKQLGNGIKEAHLLISKYFTEQRQSLEKYRAQSEQAFDYRVTGVYRSYAELLDNAYNSGWLRYVQRMLNTSMKADSSTMEHDNVGLGQDLSAFDGYEQTRWRGSLYSHYPMAQQNSGLDTKHVAMMTYMGFQQAEFVHFLPVQLKQELKRVFLSNQYRPQVLPPEITKSDQTNHAERHSFESVDSGKPSSLASTVERTFISTNDMHHVEVSSESSNINFDLMSSEPGSDSTFYSRLWVNETQSPNLVGQMHALSLTEFRLVLLVLDFFIIIYRFYHTFLSLRDLWFGQKIYVDAASLLVMQHANRPDQSLLFSNTTSVEGTGLIRLRTKNGEDHLGALGRANKNNLDRHSTSKLALLQELTQRNSRYACTHAEAEQQADLMADLEVSELDPTSEKTARNKPLDTKGHLRSGNPVNHAHPVFPTYQCFPTHPLIVFRTEPLPLEAALALPPPPSFGPEQNVGCLMSVRVTCCRQSHYLSAVVGITVVLALLGLLILQEQRVFLQPTRVDSSVWHEPKTAAQPAKAANQLNTPRLSLQLSDAKLHYEGIIDKQSKRLNGDWLAWTKSKELSMRRRLLTYTARFKHDFSFFDRQIKAESEMINAAAIRFTKNIANERQSIPIANRSADPPTTTRLNSEMLFRQQICHFLPVVPVPMPTDQQDVKSHARFTNDVDYKKMSVQNLLWTALISRAVEFEWSSLQQARQLSVTALLVATGMLGCIGIVDICGWMIQLRYLNPLYKTGHATDPNPMHRSETRSCRSNEIEVDREHIVLVSPQPPPLIPYPEDSPQSKESPRPPASPTAQTHSSLLGFGTPCVDQKFTPTATTNSSVMTTTPATNPRTSSVQPQIPLTAFYVDPNLVLASNPTLHGLPFAASSPSVPIYITHTPGSPILIASTTGIDPNQTGTTTTITTITTQPT